MANLRNDLTGKRFGRITILGRAENYKRYVAYYCLCDCGNKFTALAQNIVQGKTKSCGCYNAECKQKRAWKINRTHGLSNTRLYRIWLNMKERCFNKNSKSYKNYGAKGIKVCTSWLDFSVFSAWAISSGYSDGLTLDRIDVNKSYSPKNCRWADWITQNNNKTNNRRITFEGKTKTVSEWAREYALSRGVLWHRLFTAKMPFSEAINK